MKGVLEALLETLVAWGSGGLFLAALLDGAGVPVPGGVDVLITFLASRSPHLVYVLPLVAVAGSVVGNSFLFYIARRGGQMYLERRSSSPTSRRLRAWFEQYGLLTVFIAALVPLPVMPLKIFVISAGALGSNPLAFVLTFVGARIPRYLGLALLGRAMGDHALGYLGENVWYLAGFAFALFAILYGLILFAGSRRAPRKG